MLPAAFGTTTGAVPMHPILAQRSDSGFWECGQHGCSGTIGVHVIAAQARDPDTKVNNNKRAETLLILSSILLAALDIAVDTAR